MSWFHLLHSLRQSCDAPERQQRGALGGQQPWFKSGCDGAPAPHLVAGERWQHRVLRRQRKPLVDIWLGRQLTVANVQLKWIHTRRTSVLFCAGRSKPVLGGLPDLRPWYVYVSVSSVCAFARLCCMILHVRVNVQGPSPMAINAGHVHKARTERPCNSLGEYCKANDLSCHNVS
jgi:hypothetical protein